MLAGYLPFDDDPANPEGDNINLLYKYIVSTPLTFPEYVTPHARDLLKRILVPDPRKRADLFEVARHSWLADYSHVVGFITSGNTNATDAQDASVYSSKHSTILHVRAETDNSTEDTFEQQPPLARSASVREPGKPHTAATPVHGGLTAKREQINSPPSEKPKTTRDNKRRTVQVEYVAPQSQTVRGEDTPMAVAAPGGSSGSRMKNEVPSTDGYHSSHGAKQRAVVPAAVTSSRPRQEPQRSVSDYTAFGNAVIPMVNPQQPLWRKRMRKAAFPSQRASSTRSHNHTFSLSSPFQLIIALGSRPHNADSRYNLDRQEDLEREDTNGRTLSLRLLGV
jgi:protein-serine/threonine kinase